MILVFKNLTVFYKIGMREKNLAEKWAAILKCGSIPRLALNQQGICHSSQNVKGNCMRMPTSLGRIPKERFEELLKKLGNEIKEMYDVYTDMHNNLLIHIPISASSSFDEILQERKRLSKDDFILLGIELVGQNILDSCPEFRNKKGCFWTTDWLSPDFFPIKKPKLFKEIKRRMEKGSGWLK